MLYEQVEREFFPLYKRIAEEYGLPGLERALERLQQSSKPLIDYLSKSAQSDLERNQRGVIVWNNHN